MKSILSKIDFVLKQTFKITMIRKDIEGPHEWLFVTQVYWQAQTVWFKHFS